MYHLDKNDWFTTSNGSARGYIQPNLLRELWFHTGTNCNLRCPFCLEGSKPGDDRIGFITFEEAKSFMEEALDLGVKKFSFTGGEPFLNPDMVKILDFALNHCPCLVLTNGTEPIMNRIHELMPLHDKANSLNFRISLDHPDAEEHDLCRGRGNFQKSLTTLGRLYKIGFGVSIARLIQPGEDVNSVDEAYRPFFKSVELPENLTIISFPDFSPPGSIPNVPEITDKCMTTYLDEEKRNKFMCNFSKMVVKKNGRVGVYACTLVDDDPDYDLGKTLTESMKIRVMLKHHRCYSCFAHGSTCSEG